MSTPPTEVPKTEDGVVLRRIYSLSARCAEDAAYRAECMARAEGAGWARAREVTAAPSVFVSDSRWRVELDCGAGEMWPPRPLPADITIPLVIAARSPPDATITRTQTVELWVVLHNALMSHDRLYRLRIAGQLAASICIVKAGGPLRVPEDEAAEPYREGCEYVVCSACRSHILLDVGFWSVNADDTWDDKQTAFFGFTCDWEPCLEDFTALVNRRGCMNPRGPAG